MRRLGVGRVAYDVNVTLKQTPVPYDSIDSTEFRILYALATTGSLTQVANQLGLSQPAISQRIKRLENRLSVPLIERQGRGVRLTQAGEILAEHGRIVVSEIDAALCAIDDLRGERGGVLRMAGFPSASATIVPALMRMLAEEAPQVTFQYSEHEPPEAIGLLRDGEIDCALIFQHDEGEPLLAAFDVAQLWVEDLWLVVPEHRADGLEAAVLEDFRGDQWIAGCTRCRGHLMRAAKRRGFEPDIIHETDNMPASIAMVSAGGAVSMIPGLAIAVQGNLPQGVRALGLPETERRTIGLVSIPGTNKSPAVKLAERLLKRIDGSVWNLKESPLR